MGGSFSLPLRHVLLYALPDYIGTPRRDDYARRRLDRRATTTSRPPPESASSGRRSRSSDSSAVRRRVEARFAALLGAAVAMPLYAGGGLLLRRRGTAAAQHQPLRARQDPHRLRPRDPGGVRRGGARAAFGGDVDGDCSRNPAGGSRSRRSRFSSPCRSPSSTLDFYPECRPEEAVFQDTPGIVRLREAAGARGALRGGRLDAHSQRLGGARHRGRARALPPRRGLPAAGHRGGPERVRLLWHVPRVRSLHPATRTRRCSTCSECAGSPRRPER